MPRLPLGERVSRLAARALQKRRIAAATAAMASSTTTASRHFRTRRDHDYTPFLRGGVPVTYGAAQNGYSRVADDGDSEDENPSQLNNFHHGEDGIAFRRWPWRALNRQVSSACNFSLFRRSVHDGSFLPLSGGNGKLNQPCVAAVLMNLITTDDRFN
jgi:hypothetical protein